jgi:hypothetical protein
MSEFGSVVWPGTASPLWRFNWALADSPDQEGIAVSSVYYRDRQVFYKASLPSLRVQYSGPCGPYKDPLNYNNAQTTSQCPSTRVCQYSYVSNGLRALVIQSYHRIGAYRLTHRWTFWEDGQVYPRLYSAGLQCNYDHRHHAYWRFDFDIGGAGSDLFLQYDTNTPNQGWGNGWQPFTTETTGVKNAPSQRSWAILDTGSGRGYHLLPGSNDGAADSFSNRDFWLIRYRGTEDKHGNQGTASSDGLTPYVNGENVNGQDVVVWYCGHLSHHAHDGGDDWHETGPRLVPFKNWICPD